MIQHTCNAFIITSRFTFPPILLSFLFLIIFSSKREKKPRTLLCKRKTSSEICGVCLLSVLWSSFITDS
uniref:Uncharacterized protein n=1 Tax=Rhizophora mucronata TaxID=61149 RepID=A0A2P2MGC3_RHIMU